MKHFIVLCLLSILFAIQADAQQLNLLVGTYTKPGKSEGIYVFEFDAINGKATYKNKVTGITNPTYLTLSTNQKFVYAVSEVGAGKGAVLAFSFDSKSGDLNLLNSLPSGGDGPCYITTNKKNSHAFVANYGGGSFSALSLNKDGSLNQTVHQTKFTSNGVGKGQQGMPHAHSAVLSPDEKQLYVSDLGNDEIAGFKYLPSKPDPLSPYQLIKLPEGSGPRHFVFHPNKKFGYSVQELSGEVVAYRYKRSKLSQVQITSGVTTGYRGRRWAADIHISPDGKFLYTSNRDDLNDIAIFSIKKDGTLTTIGRQPTLGVAPRNFVIDPTGNYLLAANQNSDCISIFKRDKHTGLLTDTGQNISISSPVCLKFAD